MRTITKWTAAAGVRVVDTEMQDGKWLVAGLGMGTARCPECDALSSRRHGWRIRHLQDLPVQGAQVILRVKVTRWRCQNARCFRQTFADPLPEVAAPLGRRTRRVAELARLVGHTSGGRPAERLLSRLGLPQSDDTVLRNLKRHAGGSSREAIRVVGVDDWAWQKGSRYGTIMVDLGRREVVDVLPDRSAKATREWLAQHPGIEIVSRDRSGLYAEGARQGAPQARQVADRFHLLQNLRETIEQQLSRAPRPARLPPPEDAEAAAVNAAAWTGHGRQPALAEYRKAVSAGRGARLEDKFNRLKALQASGATASAIVRQTGFHGRTVTKWMQVEELPLRSLMAPKRSTPVRFQNHLARRWAEGCTSGRALLLEIKGLGYMGSLSQLNRLLTEWRRTGRPAATAETTTSPLRDLASGHLVSPIVAAALCVTQ